MRDILHFVSLMKKVGFVLNLQVGAPTVLCSIFEKPVTPVTVYKNNQGAITLALYSKMITPTKLIAIKYHHFCSFVANSEVKIKHVDNKKKIADIFTNPLDSELFRYLSCNLNGWYVNSILLHKEV